jgi:serine/threonine protein kinase
MSADYSSSSGFMEPGSFSKDWTGISCFQVRSRNALYVGTRYGRRFIIKSIKKEFRPFTEYQILHEKEFRLGISLAHPNIATTYSMEEVEDLGLCIVQEYVEGTTLGAWLEQNPSLELRKRAFLQLLNALKYIHSQQLVHHDLKLSNIMVTSNGNNVKLIDFGLSNTDDAVTAVSNDPKEDIRKLGEIIVSLFGNKYSRIASKCLRGEFANIEAVEKAFHRQNSRLKIVILSIAVGVLVALSAEPHLKVAYNDYKHAEYKQEATQVLDSAYQVTCKKLEKFPYKELAFHTKKDYVNYYISLAAKLPKDKYAPYYEVHCVHIAHIDSIERTLPSIPAGNSIELFHEWAENKVE